MITLTKTEEKIARLVAQKRYRSSRAAGVKNRKKGPQSNEYTDLNGFGGEMAVAKFLNTWPDMAMDVSAGGVDGTWGDLTYDVKTTKYPNGHLLAKPETAMKDHADIFILVTGEMPEYTIRGYMHADDLFQSKWLKDLGQGRSIAVPQDELTPIHERP